MNNEKTLFFTIVGVAVALIITTSVLFSTVFIDIDFKKKEDNVEEKVEEKIVEKIDENTRKTIGEYSVVSGTRNGKDVHEDFVKVFDKNNKLVKEIKNVYTLIEVKVNDNVIYLGEGSGDKGGSKVSHVLNSNLDVIIDNSKLYKDGKEHWNTFTPFVNNFNNTVAVKTDNLYIFDLNGNNLNTLNGDNIVGVYTNYFLVKDGNNINLMNYDNQYVITLTSEGLTGAHHLPISGGPINASWSDDKIYFSVVLYRGVGDIKHCTKFNYNVNTNEIFTEKYVEFDCNEY